MTNRCKFVQKSIFFATSILYAFLYEFCSILGRFRAGFGLHWEAFWTSWALLDRLLGASWGFLESLKPPMDHQIANFIDFLLILITFPLLLDPYFIKF